MSPLFNGRRQPSCGGTSRMMREYQVRNLWEARGEIPRADSALPDASTCSNRPARMLQSRQNDGQGPRSLRCLKGSITRPVAREPRSGRHCYYEVDHQRPHHSTCNESHWLGNDVAPPAAEEWI